ncbi:hypothetical protein [Rhizobium leguminosarum]|uniref:hypothetical protein n=1 Tax=Rhizobium leguminosarum TaxID=384 RepID=UPI0024749716|nr:hypothetical protein [Rhizobium leguminosarum]
MKFHDGTLFNATAVIKSFERRRDHGPILSYFLANVEMRTPNDRLCSLWAILSLRSSMSFHGVLRRPQIGDEDQPSQRASKRPVHRT